jgi:hypothetical protein
VGAVGTGDGDAAGDGSDAVGGVGTGDGDSADAVGGDGAGDGDGNGADEVGADAVGEVGTVGDKDVDAVAIGREYRPTNTTPITTNIPAISVNHSPIPLELVTRAATCNRACSTDPTDGEAARSATATNAITNPSSASAARIHPRTQPRNAAATRPNTSTASTTVILPSRPAETPRYVCVASPP